MQSNWANLLFSWNIMNAKKTNYVLEHLQSVGAINFKKISFVAHSINLRVAPAISRLSILIAMSILGEVVITTIKLRKLIFWDVRRMSETCIVLNRFPDREFQPCIANIDQCALYRVQRSVQYVRSIIDLHLRRARVTHPCIPSMCVCLCVRARVCAGIRARMSPSVLIDELFLVNNPGGLAVYGGHIIY